MEEKRGTATHDLPGEGIGKLWTMDQWITGLGKYGLIVIAVHHLECGIMESLISPSVSNVYSRALTHANLYWSYPSLRQYSTSYRL